jgi:acyl-CoA synthetase (AMP-forming)/AMP-acid ligase II
MPSDLNSNIVSSGVLEKDFTEGAKSLGEFILKKLTNGGDQVALINGKTEEVITFNEIKEKSLLVARCLYQQGIRKYDKVGIVCDNRFDFLEIAYGAIFVGAVPALINIAYKELEMDHAFSLVKPKMVFTSAYAAKRVIQTANKFETSVILIDDNDAENSFKKFLANPTTEDFLAKDINIFEDVSVVMYSSGTTGMPKGVMITHANLMFALESVMGIKTDFLERNQDSNNIVLLNAAPWFHAMGFIVVYMITCGSDLQLVFLPRFEEQTFLKSIEKFKVSLPVTVPPLLVFLSKTPLLEKYDLSSIREIACGAAPVTPEMEAAVKSRLPNVKILQVYGMTESTSLLLNQKRLDKPGSLGLLNGLTAKVIDLEGNVLGPNQKGELCFKGYALMKGYIGNEQATRETIDEEGWLHTGDVGYYDEDHQFYLVERLKELIKYNAFQVPPAEIEAILLMNPKVKEAAVFGIPDADTGEKAVAFVVKQPNVDVNEKELIDFVAQKASKPKQLHGGLYFIDQLPKNETGKVVKRFLKKIWETRNAL